MFPPSGAAMPVWTASTAAGGGVGGGHHVSGGGSMFGGAAACIPRAPPYTLSLADAVRSASHLPVACVVVATDGVWDVLATATVAAHALAFYRDAKAAAGEVVAMAKRRGSTDDVTAAVVWLTCAHGGRGESTAGVALPVEAGRDADRDADRTGEASADTVA